MSLAEIQHPKAEQVIAKALLRAADLLGVTAKELSHIVGVSEATLSRLRRSPSDAGRLSGKPQELALLFIRLYRSLDAVLGGDDAAARRWMRAENTALGAPPLQRIRTVDGLAHVLAYLDACRAPL
ncbi:MAG: antitoxin Xre/MbcA/ParS toxin-binding domain-containing protein [Rhizobiaceae bacterium]